MKLQENEEEMIKINSETSMKLQGNEEGMIKDQFRYFYEDI
jgi:hypothetical protein